MARKTDLFRLFLIYKEGGVYLDSKSIIIKLLDEVLRLDDRYIIAHWHNKKNEEHEGLGLSQEVQDIDDGEYQQWHVIAAPGHPCIRQAIIEILANNNFYRPELHGLGQRGLLRVTGPIAYSLAIKNDYIPKHIGLLIQKSSDLGIQFFLKGVIKILLKITVAL